MAQPLSPLTPRSANRNSAAPIERKSPFTSPKKYKSTHEDTENIPLSSPNGPPSSPFIENVDSPPAKLPDNTSERVCPQRETLGEYQHVELTENALRENEGLTRAVQVMEDDTAKTNGPAEDDDTISNAGGAPGYAGMDDTAFSAFSAVPNADMTRLARLGQSPTKSPAGSPTKSRLDGPKPKPTGQSTPSKNKHYDDGYSSPTPRRYQCEHSSHDDDTTNLLVDLTGQCYPAVPASERSPTRHGRLSPQKYSGSPRQTPSLANSRPYSYHHRTLAFERPSGTPADSCHSTNFLDFDLPPAPTPRSMPSISARELESMTSAFQSQISSLKAELSGKEAEVISLKNAMENAERRVGEAQEQVREEQGAKEGLQAEKAEWEKREQEMQDVLRSVKEEISHSDREKDRLMQRATESDYKREEAETKAVEAESRIAGLQAGSSVTSPSENGSSNASNEVEAAVTKVAKELHSLYKSKHEAKVTALKKSYSDRWEKKIKDLQSKIEELSRENEDFRIGPDATMTGVDPAKLDQPNTQEIEDQKKEHEALQQRLSDQTTTLQTVQGDLSTLRAELASTKESNMYLHSQLDLARAETADLVAATEELMALSQDPEPNPSAPETTRSTLSRSTSGSGLKAPGFGGYAGESRIGGLRPPAGGLSGSGKERSGSGVKSRLLGSIERMGLPSCQERVEILKAKSKGLPLPHNISESNFKHLAEACEGFSEDMIKEAVIIEYRAAMMRLGVRHRFKAAVPGNYPLTAVGLGEAIKSLRS